MNLYGALASAVLLAHLGFIAWVIFGWTIARGRRWLGRLHVASLVYGVVIEIAPWPCPLTLLENRLEWLAGVQPYRGPFLLHYLDAAVYPDVPGWLLTVLACVVCAVNLWFYLRSRTRVKQSGAVRTSGI